jgi:rare lipoprotein A
MDGFLRPFGLAFLATTLLLGGCSTNKSSGFLPSKSKSMFNSKGESLAGFAGTGSAYLKGSGPIPRGGGKFHVGRPYQIAGKWYHPKAQPGYDRQGAASWYGEAFHRRKTSNGEYFDMNMLSAAHPTLPLPSYAKVTNLENGKSVIVRINDRGPFVGTRIIDLSKRAADALEFRGKGKADVRVQWIGNAPLNDKGSHLAMMNKSLAKGASVASLTKVARGKSVDIASATSKRKTKGVEVASAETSVSSKAPMTILVGTFSKRENAEAAYDQVARLAPAQLSEVTSANSTAYKVRLGPFRSRLGAEDVLRQLHAEGFPDALISQQKLQFASSEL